MNKYTLIIEETALESRLDKFLAEELSEEVSRERVKQLIAEGAVCLGDKVVTKSSTRLKTGQTVTVVIPTPQPVQLLSEAIPLEVIYEDDDLMVINKPSGMLSHPTGKEQAGTLVNALLHHCEGALSGINGELRPGIVHRLDRQTSGLMMVAKSDQAHRGLSLQLAERTAKREYRAIAQGNPPEDKGTIIAHIGRNPKMRDKMAINSKNGRNAITHWQLLERIHDKFWLAKLNLESGRTHQIRVHLSHKNYPIIGDPLYGNGVINQLPVSKPLKEYGQFLQAVNLRFIHPITEKTMGFEIPLADEMEEMLTVLRDQV